MYSQDSPFQPSVCSPPWRRGRARWPLEALSHKQASSSPWRIPPSRTSLAFLSVRSNSLVWVSRLSSAVSVGPGEQCANPCRIRGADEAATRERHHLTGLSLSAVTRAEPGALFLLLWQPWPPCDPALLLAIPLSRTAAAFVLFCQTFEAIPPSSGLSSQRRLEGSEVHVLLLCRVSPPLCPPESSSPKSSCSLSTYLSIDNVVRPGHLVRWNFWGQASRNLLGIHTKIQSIPFI